MPQPIDVNALIAGLKAAASDVLQKDIEAIQGFSQRQLKMMADQAKEIAEGWANGELTDAQRDAFLADLKAQAQNFANVLRGLAALEIEKVWNAMVKVLWEAIGTAAGKALPL